MSRKKETDYTLIVILAVVAVIIAALTIAMISAMKDRRVAEPGTTPEQTVVVTDAPTDAPTNIPTEVPTEVPTSTPEPTPEPTPPPPTPTPTPKPTNTPAPTATPKPTATPTPKPTATSSTHISATPAPLPVINLKHKGDPTDKMIAFTFDDGPNGLENGSTKTLLDGLRERNIKVTFFIKGMELDTHPYHKTLLKMAYDDGHLIGNHTYSHLNLKRLSEQEVFNEINKTNDIVEQITGERPVFLRAPGGAFREDMMAAVGMINVKWGPYDIGDSTGDWKKSHPNGTTQDFEDYLVNTIVSKAQDGDVILMHDIIMTSVHASLRAMDILKEKGFRFVTVDELLLRNANENQTLSTTYIYTFMRQGDTRGLVDKK